MVESLLVGGLQNQIDGHPFACYTCRDVTEHYAALVTDALVMLLLTFWPYSFFQVIRSSFKKPRHLNLIVYWRVCWNFCLAALPNQR